MDEVDQNALLLQWLRPHGPDDRHKVVAAANWDFVEANVFDWTVTQQECDRATALTIFWRASPSDAAAHPQAPHDDWAPTQRLLERWREQGFARAQIAFPDATDRLIRDDELNRMTRAGTLAALAIPEGILADLEGRVIEPDPEIVEGFPRAIYPPGYLEQFER